MAYEDLYGTEYQEGSFLPVDIAWPMATSAMLHTARMTHGFKGGRWWGGAQLGDIFTGMAPEVVSMRKLAGQTMFSKMWQGYYKGETWHGGITGKGRIGAMLGRLAPSLSHLGPSRYATMLSAFAGNEAAWGALNVMGQLHQTTSYMMRTGDTYGQGMWRATHRGSGVGGEWFKQAPFDYKEAMKMNWFDSTVRGTGGAGREPLTWGAVAGARGPSQAIKPAMEIIEEANRVYKMGILPLEAEMAAAAKANAYFGNEESWVGRKVGRWAIRHGAIRGNPALLKGAALLGPTARIGGTFMIGMDIYRASTWLGGLSFKAGMGVMAMPGNIYRGATSEIHRGTFMSSGPMSPFVGATQRQRAMANIYDKQLNLRQVMGNEASFFAAKWGF